MSPSPDFLQPVIKIFQSQKSMADRAIVQTSDAALHQPLDENTNSIALIMKHVAGNFLSRWTDFLSTDGEKPWRNRDSEFKDEFTSRQQIMEFWERGWKCVFDTLAALKPEDLGKTVYIRQEPHGVVDAILRSMSHSGYHVGQIVQTARVMAKDQWQTLTIPRGGSQQFNQQMREKADQK